MANADQGCLYAIGDNVHKLIDELLTSGNKSDFSVS